MITRRNFCTNPRGIAPLTGWANNGGTSGTATNAAIATGGPNADIPTFIRATWTVAATASNGSLMHGTSVSNAYEQKVNAGDTITASVYTRASVAATVYCRVNFYDSAGAFMGAGPLIGSNNLLVANTWTRISVTGVVPVGAVRCTLGTQQTTGTYQMQVNDTLDCTGGLLEISSKLNSFFDGSTTTVDKTEKYSWLGTVNASYSRLDSLPNVLRRNMAINPGTESGVSNWLSNNPANWTHSSDGAQFHSGTKSILATPLAPTIGVLNSIISAYNVGGGIFPAYPGKVYSISVWFRHNSPDPMQGAKTGYTFLDANQATIGGTVAGAYVAAPQNTWVKATVITAPAPANVAYIRPIGFVDKVGAVQAGDLAWMDECLVEESNTVGAYFDGATAWDNQYKYSWYGAANASPSLVEPLTFGVRKNWCTNPSMEVNITGWANYAGVGGTASVARQASASAFDGANIGRNNWTVAPSSSGGFLIFTGSDTGPDLVGKVFTGSVYIRPSKTVYIQAQWQFYKNGTPTGTSGMQQLLCNTGVWTRVPMTLPPAGSGDNKISWRWYVGTLSNGVIQAGDNIDFDACLIEESTTVNSYFAGDTFWDTYKYSWMGTSGNSESYAEPANILRKNYALNPLGNIGLVTTWYTPVGGTLAIFNDVLRLTLTDATSPAFNQKVSSPLTNATGMPCQAGDVFTWSGDFRSNSAAPVALNFNFQNAAGTSVGGFNSPTTVLSSTAFTRLSFTATAPANAAWVSIQYGLWTGTKNVGETLDCKNVIVEKGSSNGPWFDGYSVSDSTSDYEWTGAAINSASVVIGLQSNAGKASDMFTQLVNAGYGPGTLVDMEYKRLLSKAGLTYPQKLSLYDLYFLTGERPRIAAFRK